MYGLFSGRIKIEEAWDFFPKQFSKSKVRNANESKNIINGCNILKILNKIVIDVEYVRNQQNCQEENFRLNKSYMQKEKKIYVFFYKKVLFKFDNACEQAINSIRL